MLRGGATLWVRVVRRSAWLVAFASAFMLALVLTASLVAPAARANAQPRLVIETDETVGPRLMGLGVQWDPYDSFRPTAAQWTLTYQRLDVMHPGYFRVVEPEWDYFSGYDAAHNPVYRWTSRRVTDLFKILDYAKSRGIPVILGDWLNPVAGGDARIPVGFIAALRDRYGYTNVRYFDPINEPNEQTDCDFHCWTSVIHALASAFAQRGMDRAVKLVGPGNAGSWDDTAIAQALDRTSGLDTDNPVGGDSWVTAALATVPGQIGAYDSHRYATIWGIEHGVYEDQMRTRREQISNADSPNKAYFGGEVGITARQVTPFSARDASAARAAVLRDPGLIDPSAAAAAGSFVDSQPHIGEFAYGVWMGDMMIQGIAAGLSGASAWDLDDAMHTGGQYGSQNLKRWGFWNSLGGKDGYPASDRRLRPWFYAWSMLARSFPAGGEPLTTPNSGLPAVRIAAARVPAPNGDDLSIAVVNDADTPRTINVVVPAATQPLTLNRYDYFAADRPADASGSPLPAAVQTGVRLASGLRVRLPSRGLVVLSTIGTGSAQLDAGTRTLIDNLSSWSATSAHGSGLRLDRSDPARFNDDPSRAVIKPKTKRAQAVIYRTAAISSFQLKAYFTTAIGLRVFGSPDGSTWTAIPVETTTPAPALRGGGWYLADVLPGSILPPNTNALKIVLTNGRTELSAVDIRSRPGISGAAKRAHLS